MRRLLFLSCLMCALLFLGAPGFAMPLVAYDFDEGSGTTATNAGTLGVALNGTITGPTYSGDTPSGADTSLLFDGSDDFVRLVTSFSYGSAFTVEAWIKPDAVDGQRIIFDDYGNPGVVFAIVDGTLQFNISTTTHPGPGIAVFGGTISTGSWLHVAGIYDGAELRTYIDTVWTGDSAATSGNVIDNSNTSSALGSDNIATNALNFAGRMDDFRIWDRALDPSELAAPLPEPGASVLLLLAAALTISRRTRA